MSKGANFPAPLSANPPGKKILAISYDQSLLDTRKMILEMHGFEVTTAYGFQEALHMCKHRNDVALVIVGHSIPRSDMLQLLQEIRRGAGAAVLSVGRREEGLLPGIDAHVDAFDSPEILIEAVRRLLPDGQAARS
jgi:DNA-binding response OmpR family regulator